MGQGSLWSTGLSERGNWWAWICPVQTHLEKWQTKVVLQNVKLPCSTSVMKCTNISKKRERMKCHMQETETSILKNRRWWIWDSPQILTSFLTFIHPHRNTQLVCCFWANQWHMWDPGQKFNSFLLRTAIERQRIHGYIGKMLWTKRKSEREKALLFWRNKTLLAPFFLANSTFLFTTDEH